VVSRTLAVGFPIEAAARATLQAALGEGFAVAALTEHPDQRRTILRASEVLLTLNLNGFSAEELALLGHLKLVQFITAGIDHIALGSLPAETVVACNAGAYAGPMAEHALAMALAAAKRLLVEHAAMTRHEFNQFAENRMLAGGVCGIFGFGGIGEAAARLFRALGMRVHGINRSGRRAETLDWSGVPSQLDELLAASDVLVISAPLTRATEGVIGARELRLMKQDAILVNLARGEIIDEAALFAHLRATPTFTACIDAWWVEPIRHGVFRMNHPFLSLPNVIASPHNSASVAGTRGIALRAAGENCRRAFIGEPVLHRVPIADRFR
jgi:glycerate dehydrogenase